MDVGGGKRIETVADAAAVYPRLESVSMEAERALRLMDALHVMMSELQSQAALSAKGREATVGLSNIEGGGERAGIDHLQDPDFDEQVAAFRQQAVELHAACGFVVLRLPHMYVAACILNRTTIILVVNLETFWITLT